MGLNNSPMSEDGSLFIPRAHRLSLRGLICTYRAVNSRFVAFGGDLRECREVRQSPEQREDPRAYPRDGEHPEREGIEEDIAVHDLRYRDGGRIGEEGEDKPCREPGKGEHRGLREHGFCRVLRRHARKAQDVQLPPSFPPRL